MICDVDQDGDEKVAKAKVYGAKFKKCEPNRGHHLQK